MYNLFIIAGMLGPWQVILIVLALLLLFGGRKIPELMKGLGQGMKEFRNATKEDKEAKKQEEEEEIKSEKEEEAKK